MNTYFSFDLCRCRRSDVIGWTVLLVVMFAGGGMLYGQNYKRTHSRAQYVHKIEIYAANGDKIDPKSPMAGAYSPMTTCAKCHDVEKISHGFHFNALGPDTKAGRKGEPWIWVNKQYGIQLPLSYRGWEGTYDPRKVGISPVGFVRQFGRHMPGAPLAGKLTENESDWAGTGKLEASCMSCHTADKSWSLDKWSREISGGKFSHAPGVAMGLMKGDSDSVKYDLKKFDDEGKVFFNVTRKPLNNSCYQCHSTRRLGDFGGAKWTHDEDVHVKAGMSCVDCHRNGIEHHTVRGYRGEIHPTGASIGTLSCVGCHEGGVEKGEGKVRADETWMLKDGGRFGAPKPIHKHIPEFHFKRLSCTACHSGVLPEDKRIGVGRVQTSLGHGLGTADQLRMEDILPGMVGPVLLKGEGGVYRPSRVMWPAFWGLLRKDGKITPLPPDSQLISRRNLRKTWKVRRDMRKELLKVDLSEEDLKKALGAERYEVEEDKYTVDEAKAVNAVKLKLAHEEFKDRLKKALGFLDPKYKTVHEDAVTVYVSGGRVWRLDDEGELEEFEHEAAKPYSWPIAHDVRPARLALGARGCADCHHENSGLFYTNLTALGPAPDPDPRSVKLTELNGLDDELMAAWDMAFETHNLFKYVLFGLTALLGSVVFLYFLKAIAGLSKRRMFHPGSTERI